MAENSGGDTGADCFCMYSRFVAEEKSLLFSDWDRDRAFGCASCSWDRDGADSLGSYKFLYGKMEGRFGASGSVWNLLSASGIFGGQNDGEPGGPVSPGKSYGHVCGAGAVWTCRFFSWAFGIAFD